MDKSSLIHSLQNVKIVIGNGADLYCLLPTSYRNFFESEEQKRLHKHYTNIRESLESYFDVDLAALHKSRNFGNFLITNLIESRLTAWHVLFYMESSTKGKEDMLWCDVEKCMHDSFLRQDHLAEEALSWASVASLLSSSKPKEDKKWNRKVIEMAWFILNKQKSFFPNDGEFYEFLKNELTKFEKQFGSYIEMVCNQKYNELKTRQKWMFERMIGNEASFRSISSVDSFNYSDITNENLSKKTRHLHGNVYHPIFGIDKNNDERSPESGMVKEAEMFTKTSRKLLQQMSVNLVNMDDNFENVIIFGHSLNRQDYSYFYPLFDRIELSNPLKNSKCIILYSLYDKSAKKSIETRLFNAIHDLFIAYDIEHLGHGDGRLIDYLVTQNRVIIYDIDKLDSTEYAMKKREKRNARDDYD